MLGPADQIRPAPAALEALAVRLLLQPRVSRVVEETCDPAREHDDRESCPPPEACCPAVVPPPYSCYLEDRNVRDVAEFSYSEHLRNLPRADLYADERRRPERPGPGEMKEAVQERNDRPQGPADPALRGPRLGDVSPVEAAQVQRRLQVVYRLTVPVGGGGRIDLIG